LLKKCSPWDHIIEDDFLGSEHLQYIRSIITPIEDYEENKLIQNCTLNTLGGYYGVDRVDKVGRWTGSTDPKTIKIVEWVKPKLYAACQELAPERLLNVERVEMQLQTMKRLSDVQHCHTDSSSKMLSCIVYIDSSNTGTFLSETRRNGPITEVEPKEGRALLFCSVKDKTWHSFSPISIDKPRTTLNFFLRN
jgi:predicted Zn-dependent protease with MMP-like domain